MSNATHWKVEPPNLQALAESEHATAFIQVIEAIPPGQLFSANDVRPHLDALDIPNASRGGLFVMAKSIGLIERAGGSAWGRYFLDSAPSTGSSARHARVAMYRRCRPDVVGGEH